MAYFAGPLSNPSPSVGGVALFSGNSVTGVDSIAVNNRFIGFVIDRTATGEPWEKNMTRVALSYWAGAGQNTPSSTSYSKIDGSAANVSYGGAYSSFTFDLYDLTGIDLSGIPSTGWNATNAACISIKAAIIALTPYATRTVTAKGGGASKPGLMHPRSPAMMPFPQARTLSALVPVSVAWACASLAWACAPAPMAGCTARAKRR